MEVVTEDTASKDNSLEREELVDSIIARNNLKFEEFLKSRRESYRLEDIPDEFLSALIPKTLYQKASDPTKVELEGWGMDGDDSLELNVTGPYLRFWETVPRKRTMMHLVLLVLKTHPQTLIVERFEVGEGLRRGGIGTEFYQRLAHIAKALGFRFIVGENKEENISFFTEKLGRVPLKEVRPELRKEVLSIGKWKQRAARPNWTTVQFLYPEDRALFMRSVKP